MMVFQGNRPKKTTSKKKKRKSNKNPNHTKPQLLQSAQTTKAPKTNFFLFYSPAISGAASDVETVYQWSVMVCVTPKLPFGLDGILVPTDIMLERANR
jgi:hypothetical protein